MPTNSAASKIEIKANSVAALFRTIDPSPLRDRDLDRDVEEFVISWARELPKDKPIQIVIYLPADEAGSEKAQLLDTLINGYFADRAGFLSRELRELFRTARYSLAIGMAVLAVCIASGQAILGALPNSELARFLNEGLIILGWVANWRPIEMILYDWLPLTRRRALLRRLSIAEVYVATPDMAIQPVPAPAAVKVVADAKGPSSRMRNRS